MKFKVNILYHMHHVKPILLVWLLALWEGCVDAEKHSFYMYSNVTDHLLYKGGKFLKKLWCCVGENITR